MENRCVMCGAIIPEGRQVCKICESECDAYDSVVDRTDPVHRRGDGWDYAAGAGISK